MSSNISNSISAMDSVFNDNSGIVRLAPAWVPRAFCTPGRRIRLHPDDYYILGVGRGGIDERWLSSAVRADNGPKTGPFEGLSLVVGSSGELIPFDDLVKDSGTSIKNGLCIQNSLTTSKRCLSMCITAMNMRHLSINPESPKPTTTHPT